ncbi:uncharacterized protein LOC142803707 [Rhipicephalus microplus]|uniref:uncharacterized protein LOC142803707 n=1 Tax=Rhipicephalus microplus TaxID=6941 RepID=UPI003F6A5D99
MGAEPLPFQVRRGRQEGKGRIASRRPRSPGEARRSSVDPREAFLTAGSLGSHVHAWRDPAWFSGDGSWTFQASRMGRRWDSNPEHDSRGERRKGQRPRDPHLPLGNLQATEGTGSLRCSTFDRLSVKLFPCGSTPARERRHGTLSAVTPNLLRLRQHLTRQH